MNLITGSTGFLGTHLTAYLIGLNQACICLYRSDEKRAYSIGILKTYTAIDDAKIKDNIVWVKANILSIPDLEKVFKNHQINYVYHCAGMISNAPSDYKMMRKTNIEGTAHIVNLSLDFSVKKFCHVSSIATLSKNPSLEAIDEQITISEHDKSNAYAIAKYGAEREAWRGSQEGLDVIIINPGVILGHGFQDQGSGRILKKYTQNFSFYLNKVTGFVGVYDCCRAMQLLMHSSLKNERFILVSENLNFKKLATIIAETYGVKKPKLKLNKWVLSLYWLFELIAQLFGHKRQMTVDLIKSLFESSTYSNQKIKSSLNFKFTSIQDVIKQIKLSSI